MGYFVRNVMIKLSEKFRRHEEYFENYLESNMRIDELNINHDELVDMVLLQGDAIQILTEKVEKLETGIDKLEKNLTDKIDQLEKRADIKDDEIGYIHWNYEPAY